MADIAYIKHLSMKPSKDLADIVELAREIPNLLEHINKLELELWDAKKELDDVLEGAVVGPIGYVRLESHGRILR